MSFAQITRTLKRAGVALNPWDEDFQDVRRKGKRVAWTTVRKLLPDATEDEISAWAEAWAAKQRAAQKLPRRGVVLVDVVRTGNAVILEYREV